MKFVIQRVTEASVEVDEKIIGEIANGYLVLIGVGQEDTTAEADRLIKKMINLRIFSDENGITASMATVLPLQKPAIRKKPRSSMSTSLLSAAGRSRLYRPEASEQI